MREPSFWWRTGGVAASALSPLGTVYGAIAARRLAKPGYKADVPVICIGNPTVGGAGKTPTAIAVAHLLQAAGERPVFLTRGYGGRLAGPVRVDASHRALDAGDEPLLLAREAPTIVARRRDQGARSAVAAGASVIVMDDGFQNPSLAKDFSILVVDGRRGIGNGRVIPAGPLRAPLGAQLARAQALVVIGSQGRATEGIRAQARACNVPAFDAKLVPEADLVAELRAGEVLAFAGIGDPEKFFATLREAGMTLAATRRFDDHHRYTRTEAEDLCRQADREGLMLVTTEKDFARMQGDADSAALAARTRALPVTLRFSDEEKLATLLRDAITSARLGRGPSMGKDASN